MAKNKTTNYIFKILPEEEQKLLEALVKYGSVKIGKFGIFELRQIKERKGWNPKTKQAKVNPAYIKIAFRALTKSKEYVNSTKVDTTK